VLHDADRRALRTRGFRIRDSLRSLWSTTRGEPLFVFLVCLAGWTLSNLDQSLFGYAIPGIRAEFGSALSDIGWILSASFLAAAVLTVILGVLSDTKGRKPLFIATLAISALLVGMQAFAPTFLVLAIIRVAAFGVSNGLAPIVLAYNVEVAPARLRGIFTGFLNCGYPLGWFIGSLIAAPLIATHGWRAIFLPALLVIPLALLLSRWLPESKRFRDASLTGTRTHSRGDLGLRFAALFDKRLRRRTIACMTANFLFGGAYAGTAFYLPTFYHEVRGYPISRATYIVGLAYGLGTLGYILAAIVGEFVLSRRNTSALWFVAGAASLTCMVWLPSTFAEDVVAFGVTAAFFYGSQAVFGTFSTEIFPTRIRATAMAFSASFANYLGFAIFPLIVAWAVPRIGWQWAFTLVSAPMLCLAAMAILQIENFQSGIDVDAIG